MPGTVEFGTSGQGRVLPGRIRGVDTVAPAERIPMTLRTAFALLLMLALVPTALHADVLTTTDGLVLEVKILP